jgi:hypothetical protein
MYYRPVVELFTSQLELLLFLFVLLFRVLLVCLFLQGYKKLRGFRPRANYADRATATCWRSSANFCG